MGVNLIFRIAAVGILVSVLCLRGGTVNNGGQCGLSTLNDNNDVSNANVNYGAALNFNISQYGVFALRSRQQGQTSPHGETYT